VYDKHDSFCGKPDDTLECAYVKCIILRFWTFLRQTSISKNGINSNFSKVRFFPSKTCVLHPFGLVHGLTQQETIEILSRQDL